MSAEPTPAPPSRFDGDTAVRPLEEAGLFEVTIDPGWWVMVAPNGGYVAAILVRALEAVVEDPGRTARSLTIHYLERIVEGPALVRVVREREGRSLTSLSVRMEQGGRTVALALAAFSAPWEAPPLELTPRMPDVPPPGEARPIAAKHQDRFPEIFRRYEFRPAGGERPFSGADRAEVAAWVRLAEGERPIDAALLAAFSDACAPAVFPVLEAPRGLPTVDLTLHFRGGLPLPPDWVYARFRTQLAREGIVEEDGELWSRSGTLLAQSRQLALLR